MVIKTENYNLSFQNPCTMSPPTCKHCSCSFLSQSALDTHRRELHQKTTTLYFNFPPPHLFGISLEKKDERWKIELERIESHFACPACSCLFLKSTNLKNHVLTSSAQPNLHADTHEQESNLKKQKMYASIDEAFSASISQMESSFTNESYSSFDKLAGWNYRTLELSQGSVLYTDNDLVDTVEWNAVLPLIRQYLDKIQLLISNSGPIVKRKLGSPNK